MAAAKALTIVDRWEVGGVGVGGGRWERMGSQRKKMMHRKKKWIQEWIFNLIIVHEAT